MDFDPNKQHIVFVNRIGDIARLNVPIDMSVEIIGTLNILPLTPKKLAEFDNGEIKVMVMGKGYITGWHTKLTADQVDVHFTFEPNAEERAQGMGRVAPKDPT